MGAVQHCCLCPSARALMSTGARRLWRSFLCTHRKFISAMATLRGPTRSRAGTPVMNATSFPLPACARTAGCDVPRQRKHLSERALQGRMSSLAKRKCSRPSPSGTIHSLQTHCAAHVQAQPLPVV